MRTTTAVAVIVTLATAAQAAPPAGWRTLPDRKGACQVSVPPELKGEGSVVYSADKNVMANVHGTGLTKTWAEAVDSAQQVMKPVKMIQNDRSHLIYTYDPGKLPGGGKFGLYAGTPGLRAGTAACTVQIQYSDPAFDVTARAIGDSLAAVK